MPSFILIFKPPIARNDLIKLLRASAPDIYNFRLQDDYCYGPEK